MKKIIISLFAAGLLLISCKDKTNDKKSSEEINKKETSQEPMDSATMMKHWMAYMTPGEPHKMMAKYDGEWETENTMWMAPDAPPTITKGTCLNMMIMDGRYQVSNNKGNFNGMPFEGISTLAYDNAEKMYKSTWIDNFGTGIMTMNGTYNDSTKTINFKGDMIDPMTGKNMNVRETFTFVDDNTQIMEMYAPTSDGKAEYKTMNIKFTRKK